MEITEIKIPPFYEKLSQYKKDRLVEVFDLIQKDKNFEGVLWGGSVSYKENTEGSDVDLFCLVTSVEDAIIAIQTTWIMIPEMDIVLDQGSFPWLGKTLTLYYKKDLDFSIDIGLVAEVTSSKFFWEPKGHVLLDRLGKIQSFLAVQLQNPNFTHLPFIKKNPFSRTIVSLRKIHKNIARNHLWNAYFLMNQMRNTVIEIIRIHHLKELDFLGRPDRDIEEVMPADMNVALSATVASYDGPDIAKKTVLLAQLLKSLIQYSVDTNEQQLESWLVKQIDYEIKNLNVQYE